MKYLRTHFAVKDLGTLSYFLGIQVQRSNDGLFLCQKNYIEDLLTKAKMSDCKPLPTSMISHPILSAYTRAVFDDLAQYRRIVGGLKYVTITRPELAYCVNKLCQFMHKPRDAHWKAAKRVFRYLQGTCDMGLKISSSTNFQLRAYSDAD